MKPALWVVRDDAEQLAFEMVEVVGLAKERGEVCRQCIGEMFALVRA